MTRLSYTTKKFNFTTPEELQDKMIEYLENIDKLNADYTTKFCKNCGFVYSDVDTQCCDEPNIEYRLVHKPTYEYVRPTVFGFVSYIGMGISTYYLYKTREGFDEVVEWFSTILQMELEQLLLNPFNRNVGGAKFVAVNNFGWKDKTYVEQVDAGKVVFVNDISKLVTNEENLRIEEDTDGD